MNQYNQFLKIEEFPGSPDLSSKAILYTLSNSHGMEVQILNYGGIIRAIKVPDKTGKQVDVTLGYNSLEDYRKCTSYIGSTVGRTAGRIGGGKFTIPEGTFELSKNEKGITTLHGGFKGFNQKFWTPEIDPLNPLKLTLSYTSVDGEEGYPGNVVTKVTFELDKDKTAFTIYYDASVDKPCPLYLTNHSYFNLNGESSGIDILNNELLLNSNHFMPLNSDVVPTGEKCPVDKTPQDFRVMTPIGKRIHDSTFEQFKITRGYDHPWLLDNPADHQCEAYCPTTGIKMEVKTTEPAVVVYTSNYMDGTMKGKSGKPYIQYYGFCMETSSDRKSVV